ncbi:MAG: tetratricopeptide repeat protein, partial [Pirellulaceae bacterium]|nr:tetratricopeptide repeat protein [Pirellulaceae bacterium]
PLEMMASAHQRLGQNDQAIQAYKQAIQFRPAANAWRVALAELLIKQDRLEEAAREMRTALLFEADDPKLQELRDRISKLQRRATSFNSQP